MKPACISLINKWLLVTSLILVLLPCLVPAKDSFNLDEQLLIAAIRGDVAQVKKLLATGANINWQFKGRNALMLASRNLHVDVVKILLKKGAATDLVDQLGWTALTGAVRLEAGDIMRERLKRGLNYKDGSTQSAWNRRATAIQLLRAYGAKVSLTDAAILGDITEVRRLLKNGSNVNESTRDGMTPLMGAAGRRHVEVVKTLLDRGADVNAKDMRGMTALMGAVGLEYSSFSRVFIVGSKNDFAIRMEGPRTSGAEVVKLLLDSGADVNAKASNGFSVLMAAAYRGDKRLVELLLDKGVAVNAKDKESMTALMNAAQGGALDIVQLLLKHGADARVESTTGWTALKIAKTRRDQEMVKVLVAHSAAN